MNKYHENLILISSTCATLLCLHQRQATSTWWCSPLPYTGEGRNGLSIPRGSHPRAILFWTTLLIFYPCCPMRGHMWIALLNPIDRPLPLLFSFGHFFLVPPSTPTSSLLIPLTADSYLYASPYQR